MQEAKQTLHLVEIRVEWTACMEDKKAAINCT